MLQLPVLIEPLPEGKGFVARLGDPFNLSATAATEAEALLSLQEAYERKLAQGARVAALPARVPLFPPSTGYLPDDDLTREWLDAVEEYRKACDAADRERILGESPDEKAAS